MFRLLKVFVIGILLGTAGILQAQNNPQVSYVVVFVNSQQEVRFHGTGFLPVEDVYLTVNVPVGACGYFTQYMGVKIATTAGDGSFDFVDQVKCNGAVLYQFSVGTTHLLVDVAIGSQPPVVTPIPIIEKQCTKGTNLIVGMSVTASMNIVGWTTVQKDHKVHQFLTGDQMVIVQGPLCTDEGMFWRVARRFSFVAKSSGLITNTEEVSWIPDEVNGTETLFSTPNTLIETVSTPLLSTTRPQLYSVLSIQGQRVWSEPSIQSSRVTAIKLSDGAVDIIGRNGNGTFFEVELPNRKIGWVCSHLTVSNASLFSVPIVDGSTNACY